LIETAKPKCHGHTAQHIESNPQTASFAQVNRCKPIP
jgi:hypothetical protein